jgi:hypothetical protein
MSFFISIPNLVTIRLKWKHEEILKRIELTICLPPGLQTPHPYRPPDLPDRLPPCQRLPRWLVRLHVSKVLSHQEPHNRRLSPSLGNPDRSLAHIPAPRHRDLLLLPQPHNHIRILLWSWSREQDIQLYELYRVCPDGGARYCVGGQRRIV